MLDDPRQHMQPLRIAVIGSGIAGMSAAWLLSQRHAVTMFEKNTYIGGHSHTVDVLLDNDNIAVDTGFIVYNQRNYPNLTALFDHLQVSTAESDMSFAASLAGGSFEYAGTDVRGLLGQPSNIAKPRFWLMIRDILRFYRQAPKLLQEPDCEALLLADYLKRERYHPSFINDHLLPMAAAIWSTSAAEVAAYPAAAFIRFFVSHGLLSLSNRPQWRTVLGGSRNYVDRLTKTYCQHIRRVGVTGIKRQLHGVVIHDDGGESHQFDYVVLATHADEAYRLLRDPDRQEQSLLAGWRYTRNKAVLHQDASLMPRRKQVWASWNFVQKEDYATDAPLCVSYWMNRLQPLPTKQPIFLTLNPTHEPAADVTLHTQEYTHPFFDAAALASQKQLWSLQGHRRTWYCGSYFGYGFHEDALQSGLAVAEALGGQRRPWTVPNQNNRLTFTPPQSTMAAA